LTSTIYSPKSKSTKKPIKLFDVDPPTEKELYEKGREMRLKLNPIFFQTMSNIEQKDKMNVIKKYELHKNKFRFNNS